MKTYKGYELISDIVAGKIEQGTRFKRVDKVMPEETYIFLDHGLIWEQGNIEVTEHVSCFGELRDITFELIEEKQDIDIQDIKETDITVAIKNLTDNEFRLLGDIRKNQYKLNELIQAIKQLDRQINNN